MCATVVLGHKPSPTDITTKDHNATQGTLLIAAGFDMKFGEVGLKRGIFASPRQKKSDTPPLGASTVGRAIERVSTCSEPTRDVLAIVAF